MLNDPLFRELLSMRKEDLRVRDQILGPHMKKGTTNG
jgi:hypothetical protein